MSIVDDDISQLADYSDDESGGGGGGAGGGAAAEAKKQDAYVGVHASSFKDFLLKPELQRAIADAGFEHPSTIQQEALPQALLGTDVLAQGRSGMGKTAVFVLAVLEQLQQSDHVQAVILAHTRELAYQTRAEFQRFAKYLPNVKTAVYYGGIPIATNKQALKDEKPNIVIGTPGRLLQLVADGDLDLSHVKHFVLDECDSLLAELDMRRQVQGIFVKSPPAKQTIATSATIPDEVYEVLKKFLTNPLEIRVTDSSTLTLHGLAQYQLEVDEAGKSRALVDLIDNLEFNQLVVFVNGISRARELGRLLKDVGFPAAVLTGAMKQPERIQVFSDFKAFKHRILVATDLFGRGLDVERVSITIQFDFAKDADTYLHRVGRAGRFGTKGLAISFVTSEDDKKVLAEVESRFGTKLAALPEEIDSSTYMG